MAQDIAQLQVSLNLDTSKFKLDIASATRQVETLKSALSGLRSRTFKIDLSTNIKSQIIAFRSAGKEITTLQQKLRSLEKSIRATTGQKTLNLNVNTNADKVSENLGKMNLNSKSLKIEITELSSVTKAFTAALNGLKISSAEVNSDLKRLITSAKELKLALSGVDSQFTRIGSRTINFRVDSNASRVASETQQTLYRMTKTFTNSSGSIKKTFTGIGSTVGEATGKVDAMASSMGLLRQQSSKLQTVMRDSSGKITSTMNEATRATNSTTTEMNKLKSALINVKSVAQGIIIAQGFYTIVNSIQEMAGSMWDMYKATETTTMAFEQLVGSAENADKMVTWLQQYAATTTFTFEQASQSAKTLLAYGFDLKNLGYVMGTIGDATSAFGKPENFDRIALAMGQMLAKGTVKAEELRQLMEANIPVIDILSKKLGMTTEEIVNIGDHSVNSTKAVNALLEGLNERYGGMSEKMATTTTGLINNIRESIAYVGSQLFKPIYDSFSGMLKPIANTLGELSNVIRNAGIDGALKYLFPPDMVNSIKVFLGLLKELGASISNLWNSLAPLRQALLYTFVNIFNIAAPIVIGFLTILNKLISIVASNRIMLQALITTFVGFVIVNTVTRMVRDFSIGLGILYKAVNLVKNSIVLLRGAMTLLATHPIVAGIALISAAFIGLLMSTEKGREAVDKLWISLARLMGIKDVDIYEPLDPEDLLSKNDDFFDSINDSVINGMEGAGDAAEDAGKKVNDKFVASFDELFQVPEKLDDVSDAMDGIGDIGNDLDNTFNADKMAIDTGAFKFDPIEIKTIILPPVLPKLPVFEPVLIPVLVTGLAAALAAISALIKALAAIPGKVSSWVKVQMPNVLADLQNIRNGLVAIPEKISSLIDIQAPNAIPTLQGIGDAIRNSLIPGLGLIPGTLQGTVFPSLDEFLKQILGPLPGMETLKRSIEVNVIPQLDALAQKLLGPIPPLVQLAQTFTGTVFPEIDEFVRRMRTGIITSVEELPGKIGDAMANVGPAIQGAIPLIGTAVAGVCAAILSPFAQVAADVLSSVATGFANVIQYFVNLPGNIGSAVSSLRSTLTPHFENAWEGIKSSCEGFMGWMEGKWGWLAGALALIVVGIGITLAGGWAAVGAGIMAVLGPVWTGITGGFAALPGTISGLLTTGGAAVLGAFTWLTTGMTTAFADSKDGIEEDATELKDNLFTKMSNLKDDVVGKFTELKDSTVEKFTNMKDSVISKATELKDSTVEKFTNMKDSVISKVTDMKSNISTKATELKDSTVEKFTNMKDSVISKVTDMKSNISTKFSEMKSNATSKTNELKDSVVSKCSEMKSNATSKISELKSNITSKFSELKSSATTTWNNIKSAIESPIQAAKRTVEGIMDWFGSKFTWLSDKVSNMKSSVSSVVSNINPFKNIGATFSVVPDMRSIPTPISPLMDSPIVANSPVSRESIIKNTRQATLNDNLNMIPSYNSNNSDNLTNSRLNSMSYNESMLSSEGDTRDIMYVGTLIADDRSLKELERKMQVIRLKDRKRRG